MVPRSAFASQDIVYWQLENLENVSIRSEQNHVPKILFYCRNIYSAVLGARRSYGVPRARPDDTRTYRDWSPDEKIEDTASGKDESMLLTFRIG